MINSSNPIPSTRWNPTAAWLQPFFHPPTPGATYLVRQGTDGAPFYAYFTDDRLWRHVLPDANADGTRELGERLAETNRLYYLQTPNQS